MLRFRLYALVEAAAIRSTVLRYAGVPIATRVSFFFFFSSSLFGDVAFSEHFFVPFPLSLYMEIRVRRKENSINQKSIRVVVLVLCAASPVGEKRYYLNVSNLLSFDLPGRGGDEPNSSNTPSSKNNIWVQRPTWLVFHRNTLGLCW